MKFRSLSATALERAIECPASFKAHHVDYAAEESGEAAMVGTAVHGALETYVVDAIMGGRAPATLATITSAYGMAYQDTFGALDPRADTFIDGLDMVKKWHARTDFSGFEVLLCEVKEEFPVPLPDKTMVPFRYKWDRFDKMGPGFYRVVDYKTIRAALTTEQLRRKLQAQCYALAAQIRHKDDIKTVLVEFDLLRYDTVGVVFTRDEIIDIWRMLKAKAASLYAEDEDHPTENINPGCRWCLRKAGCESLQSNSAAGGIESIHTIGEVVDLRHKLDAQRAGLEALIADLDDRLLRQAEVAEVDTIEGNTAVAELSASWRRKVVDNKIITHVLGPQLAAEYGTFTVGKFDQMMRDPRISETDKQVIKRAVQRAPGDIKVKTRKA